jgi:PAS domain S-box-containing protein
MSANVKIVFIVVISVGSCLLSIFLSQHFLEKENNNQLVLSYIEQIAVRIEQLRLLERNFIQNADPKGWGEISQTMESIHRDLQEDSVMAGRWRQEIEVLNRSLKDYHRVLTQLYKPAVNLKSQKKALQQIGLTFSRQVEEQIIIPYRKEEGLRIYDGEPIDPFKARAKDTAYDLMALHIKQQLILLEFILSSDLQAYNLERQHFSTALARHKTRLRYMAVLMGNETAIQSVLNSLEKKLDSLIDHEQAIIENFSVLTELDGRLSAAGDKLLADGRELSLKITSDTLRANRLNRIWSWSLLLGILGALSILGSLLARNIIQFVEDLKAAQKQLKESEKRFRHLSEATFEGIAIHDEGILLQANDQYFEMFGYEPYELIGKDAIALTATPGSMKLIRNQISSDNLGPYELICVKKDGTEFPLEILVKVMDLNDKKLRMAAFRDLTERKRAEEALRENEEKYRLLVETANDAIFIVQDDVVKFPNPSALELIGYTEEELTKIPFTDLIHPVDRNLVLKRRMQRLAGEKPPSTYAFRIINKAREELWVQINTAFITWEGSPATINFIRDITEQKNLEAQLQQAQKMEAIGTLAGGIAHDFNNILGIILGNTELAMDDIPGWNPTLSNLKEILSASLRARDVVTQLLSFARKTELERKPTNIIPIVKESLRLLRSSIPTSIDIRQNIAKNVGTILADATQIHLILINLCTNASHAMPDGGVLTVSLKNVELDEDSATQYTDLNTECCVNLTVSDTGHGILKEEIDRIFDPYFTTKEIGKGTGMGLAVVHGIVKGHDGRIDVKSEPGKGTIFSIFFPVVEGEAVSEIETDEEFPTGNERILFVDDEPSMVHVGRYRLERLGYQVEAQTSPVDALELFRVNPDQFDLVITDMTMPRMTGKQLVKEILEIRPDMPTIICTGFSEKMDEEKAKGMGIRHYIEKPINRADLAKLVRKVLDEK